MTRAVTIPATGITVTPETASVNVGDTTSLTAALAPAGATDIVSWESSDPVVATVNASGVVTGVAAGTATITAKARTFTDTVTITVTEL
ncbi:Ig-like domain-containing protein [Citrobacter amalonaticus]|nr:Ig-like domain-containing protein [Citrobacter amalonaticus]MEB0586104.1 Ig-like domain-containing protein [Citrobacter amalonaticus]